MSAKENSVIRKRSQLSLIWHRLRRNRLAMLGLALMLSLIHI